MTDNNENLNEEEKLLDSLARVLILIARQLTGAELNDNENKYPRDNNQG